MLKNPDIPIALHLDHGDSFELCKSCIDGGFTSVMIDASSKSFEDNIALTKQVVEYAHAHGVVVEAELGTLAGVEDEVVVESGHERYTRPEEVEEFVDRTGCDSLAIAIGTTHGAYKFKASQCTCKGWISHFVSTFLKSASSVFRASRSFFMVPLQFHRNLYRW